MEVGGFMRKIDWLLFWAGSVLFAGCDAQEQLFQTGKEKTPKALSSTSSTMLSNCDLPEAAYSLRDITASTRFTLPANAVSFLLSVSDQSGAAAGVVSLTNPRGIDLLRTPPLNTNPAGDSPYFFPLDAGGEEMLVPIVPVHAALAGEWSFSVVGGTQVQLITRTGATPTKSTVIAQAYLSGSRYSASEIQPALDVFKKIYENAGVNICLKATRTIAGSEFSTINTDFNDPTTRRLISQGTAGVANIFFVEDFTGSSGTIGIAPGIPGSQGIAGNRNGVLVGLNAHLFDGILDNQLLGESAAHELGHWFGLFHTTERDGRYFDPLSDTAECPRSRAANPFAGVKAEECLGLGGENNMFWAGSPGVRQTTLTADQIHIINYSPIAQ